MALTDLLVEWVAQTIAILGYAGIAFLMMLESIIFPLPSEIILPLAGFLVSQGLLNFWLVVLAATIGSVIGSGISYEIGRFGGRPFLVKYGRFFLLNEQRLRKTDEWFNKHGEGTVLVSRLLPITRYFISIPAGIARMDRRKFFLYTAIGAFIWNLALTGAGLALGTHWLSLLEYGAKIEIIAVVVLVAVIVWYVLKAVEERTKVMTRLAKSKQVQAGIKTARRNLRRMRNLGKKP